MVMYLLLYFSFNRTRCNIIFLYFIMLEGFDILTSIYKYCIEKTLTLSTVTLTKHIRKKKPKFKQLSRLNIYAVYYYTQASSEGKQIKMKNYLNAVNRRAIVTYIILHNACIIRTTCIHLTMIRRLFANSGILQCSIIMLIHG